MLPVYYSPLSFGASETNNLGSTVCTYFFWRFAIHSLKSYSLKTSVYSHISKICKLKAIFYYCTQVDE